MTRPKPVSFVREVAPILVAKCQACHGPKTAESNYRLDSFEAMMQPGDFGTPPITAGDLENSEIHRLITAEDAEERMPNNGRPAFRFRDSNHFELDYSRREVRRARRHGAVAQRKFRPTFPTRPRRPPIRQQCPSPPWRLPPMAANSWWADITSS